MKRSLLLGLLGFALAQAQSQKSFYELKYAVIVTRHGQVVWDSAACKPAAVKAVRFTPGVPQVLTLMWNPEVTQPAGCAGSLPFGSSGTLDAVAMSHGQSSPVRAFTLDR